jgi:hypothetical protein
MYQLLSIHVKFIPDSDPDTSYLEQEGFEDRLRQYKAGVFDFIGIRAEATIVNAESRLLQFIHSGGLWGVESDTDGPGLEEIIEEQLEELKAELKALGVSWDQEKQNACLLRLT